jgi:cytokinin dehydrogenase
MPLDNFPSINGTVLLDDATRRQFSTDIARNLVRIPRAVVRPVSAEDVVKTLQYANQRQLKVAVRGQGHSRYGETLAQDGIVIDSSTLNRVSLPNHQFVDAQSGAFWGEVASECLAQQLTPSAMGTCPKLSVGGILSAGGFSNSSHIYGAIADTVEEMDVVTGAGNLVTCSREVNPELFDMVRAGMGQCAIIVRARIRLISAPATVVRQDLFYDNLRGFLADGERLVLEQQFHHVTSRATQRADGRWIFSINVGKFYGRSEEPEWVLVRDRMNFQNKAEPVRAGFWDYLMRESAKNTADADARAKVPRREPSLTMFIPLSSVKNFVSELLESPAEMAGLTDFQLNPFHTLLIGCPLFKFPDEDVAYGVWLYPRNVPFDEESRYQAVVEINRRILERMRPIGGKSYPPYAPYFSQGEWEEHYGPQTWRRLAAAKREHDPNHVLTPEMCMFDGGSGG